MRAVLKLYAKGCRSDMGKGGDAISMDWRWIGKLGDVEEIQSDMRDQIGSNMGKIKRTGSETNDESDNQS